MKGKVVAEDVTNKTSMGSIGLFFGLLVGLAVSSFGGIVGSRKVNDPRVAV